jgi:hypothetical protein
MIPLPALLVVACLAAGDDDTSAGPGSLRNPEAVREVLSGKRTEANAAWWGFDPEDAIQALQDAIRSGAKRVVVPNVGRDWVVRPIQLSGKQELVLEPGVVIAAKRGEYRGGGDTVFSATGVDDLTIRGAGATIRMNKEDYIVGGVLKNMGWNRWFGQYDKAEWRSGLVIRGGHNVRIEGLTIRDTGGDGIMIAGAGGQPWATDVHLQNITFDNNYRQGISVISVDGLVVEGCLFKNTWGTPPSSGVDIEPDTPDETIKRVIFRHCRLEDNYGDGIEVFLANLKTKSGDVSILFENCRVSSRWGSGIRVTRVHDDGPGGLVEFRDCVVENTQGYGIKVQDKSAGRARVRFIRCTVRNASQNRNFQGAWTPVWLNRPHPDLVKKLGGIEFIDSSIEDNHPRPALLADGEGGSALTDVSGNLRVSGPSGAKVELQGESGSVALEVSEAKAPKASDGAAPR